MIYLNILATLGGDVAYVTKWDIKKHLGEVKITAEFSDGRKLKLYFHSRMFTTKFERIKLEGVFSDTSFRPPNELYGNKSLLKEYWRKACNDADTQGGIFAAEKANDIRWYMRDTRSLLDQL